MKRIEYYNKNFKFAFIAQVPTTMVDNLPIIIQLHGAGERGNSYEDLNKVEVHGFTKEVFTEEAEVPCILIMPQCEENSFWVADIVRIKDFIEQVVYYFKADKERIYLTGLSMGGYGCWYTAMAYPKMFAAIAPCCGGCMPWNSDAFEQMPIWAFHGALDNVVKLSESLDMYEKISTNNPNMKLTIFEDVKHNCWSKAYNKELFDWLLQWKNTYKV